MNQPIRVQLRLTKGWRMPQNTVSVARPSPFGNPFIVRECREAGYVGSDIELAARCVGAFEVWAFTPHWRTNWDGEQSQAARVKLLSLLPTLRGKNLACFCALDRPCHADALLKHAKEEPGA